MAKKKKEEPIVDNETGSLKVKEKQEVQPKGNETKGNVTKVKEKMKMKPQIVEETVTKVDLSKPLNQEENEIKEDNVDDSGVVTELENAESTQEQEKVQPEAEAQETLVLEEVAEEKVEEQVEEIAEKASEAIKEINCLLLFLSQLRPSFYFFIVFGLSPVQVAFSVGNLLF